MIFTCLLPGLISRRFFERFSLVSGFCDTPCFFTAPAFLAESLTTQLLLRVPFVWRLRFFTAILSMWVNNEHALREKAEKERVTISYRLPNVTPIKKE